MNDDISAERLFMKEFWDFRKKHYEVKPDPAYWQSVINDANDLMAKYHSDYFHGLVLTCIDDLEHRFARSEGREMEHSIVENVYNRIMDKREKAGEKK